MPKIRDIAKVRQKWEALSARRSDSAAKTKMVAAAGNQNSPLFSYFMAGKHLELQIAFEKQQLLIVAMERADWSAPILNDAQIEQIALQCFKDSDITYQQFITIIDRQQHQLDFPGEAMPTYPLLNEDDSYTDYAKETFLPLLEKSLKSRAGINFTEEHAEYLRLLIATLPKSEQIVYTTRINYRMWIQPGLSYNAPLESTNNLGSPLISLLADRHMLLQTVIKKDSCGTIEEQLLTSLSAGLKDATEIACYGLKRYVPPLYRLNPITPQEIEEGICNDFRPASMLLKDDPLFSDIHRRKMPHRFGTTVHDNYHTEVMSRMPINYRKAFRHIINITRLQLHTLHEAENSKKRMPQENLMTYGIWSFIDGDFSVHMNTFNFFKEREKAKKHGIQKEYNEAEARAQTEIFYLGLELNYSNTSGLTDSYDHVSVFGMIVFVDMLRNPLKWQEDFCIMPKFFSINMKNGYDCIQKISTYDNLFLIDPPKMQALKLHLFQQLNIAEKSEEEITSFFRQIEDYCSENGGIDEICQFKRVSRKQSELPGAKLRANQVYLEIDSKHQALLSDMKAIFELAPKEPQRSRCVGICSIM